jgi:hypothetical protein
MRIPFPERIPMNRVGFFVIGLFAIQRLEGTTFHFSIGCAVFVLIAAVTFNHAGGLTRASGAYVAAYSLMAVLIGVCYKAFLGEPGQSNLLDPRTDIDVYVGSIAAMFAAVVVSRRFSRKTGLLQNLLKESEMYRASVGCIAFGVVGAFAIALLGESAGKLETAFAQLNQLIPLGIIIGVIYEIRRSGGKRCTNIPIVLGALYFFFLGMTGFSKQGMLLPLFCWVLPVAALRFRLSAWQMLSCLVTLFAIFYYLVPFAQYGRGRVPENATLGQRVAVAIPLLEDAGETRRLYYEQENLFDRSLRGLSAYYDTPQGFWERLQMISPDDKLIDITDRGRVFGLLPIKLAFINAIPHIFWPNKPGMNTGNVYAHEISGENQGEGDTATGISFSPSAEAYHLAKWVGVFVLAPMLWGTLFIVFDSLFGDLRATPWGILAFAMVCFYAPEGGLTGLIYLLTFGTEILLFCAFFATWVAPVFAIPILGPDRRKALSGISLQPTLAPRTPR